MAAGHGFPGSGPVGWYFYEGGQAREGETDIRIVLCSASASGKTRKVFFIRVRDVDDA